jgi:hypothetical protein
MKISISKNDKRSIYVVNKNKEAIQKIGKLLESLNIVNYEKINRLEKDKRIGFDIGKNSYLDLIFGNKKIFIILSYNKDLQNKFSEAIHRVMKK